MRSTRLVMKQYTTPEQTSKLIELGFEKPKGWVTLDFKDATGNYSIGELIEMLPEFSNIYDLTNLHTMKRCWYVGHVSTLNVSASELIDALFEMVIKLKEEGII